MKYYFSVLILIVIFPSWGCKKNESITPPNSSQGEWKIIRIADSANYFNSLYFADQLNGWAIGNNGTILHTSNGGDSWNVQPGGSTTSLQCVFFSDSQNGWIGGANNSIGITSNGGNTWTWQHPAGESNRTYMSLSFVNKLTGWIVDNYGGILHTEDGGKNWTPQISGTIYAITAVQFLDANTGWAAATNRIILHTTDGGNNWRDQILDSLNYGYTVIYTDIFFNNSSHGWVATNALASNAPNPLASIVCSSDTGRNWNCHPLQADMISSIQFINSTSGWAAARRGILHTTDGGTNWSYQLSIPSGPFVKLCFVDQSHGWAITYSGSVYKYQIN